MQKLASLLFIFHLIFFGVISAESTELPAKDEIVWIDARELGLEGQGWPDESPAYDRIPDRAEPDVSEEVWNLKRHAAGVCIRFETDSPEIHADWDGGGDMYHMPRSGVSGLDLYRWDGSAWRWHSIGRPKEERTVRKIASAPSDAEGFTEYLLFLPLYQEVTELKLGFKEGSTARPATRKRSGPPIVFYGTSITQGGCASRAGMSHPAILSRRLDHEVINLGFSGAGRMEPIMAELVRELDAELYVLECLGNMTMELVEENVAPFVRLVRESRPETPILMVENCNLSPSAEQNRLYRSIYEELVKEGIPNLHYMFNHGMLDGPEEGTVDGVHPTDLGFARMADYYEPILRDLLALYDYKD